MSRFLAGRTATAAFLFMLIAAWTASPSVAEDQAYAFQDADEDSAGISTGPHPLVFKSTTKMAANPNYAAGDIQGAILGDRYREAWTQPIDVPVIDLDRTSGGLTVTGSAGGLQTKLLFLKGEDGRHYVLRTLDKEAGKALPPGTRNTIVEDIAQDQISSLHPYGAFIVPELAQPAGLLHTHPVLVLVPESPRLGEHEADFAGKFALLERNVTEDVSSEERFGFAEDIVDTETLIERVNSGEGHIVDERAFLKSRLFDMLIGDRDRHAGQYFWAAFDEGSYTRYEPIPIDRDFAFARFDGLLSRAGRHSGNIRMKRLTNFDEDINNLVGLNYQGAVLDYYFTSRLTEEDWLDIARELQRDITDDVIDNAIGAWPDAVQQVNGSITASDLKARRDDLLDAAEDYFEMMALRVDVIGTAKNERFEIRRTGPETVEVSVVQTDDHKTTYHRSFDEDDTQEIRLYGLGGAHRFDVLGDEAGGIVIRAIGGDGDDVFRAESDVRDDLLYYYDTAMSEANDPMGANVDVLSDSLMNAYQMHRFAFNSMTPKVSFDYDSDQGIFLGAGMKFTRFGYMKRPYAAQHLIAANYAPRSEGFNVHYDGHMVDVLWDEWDAVVEANVLAEDVFRDFYGFGNETVESNRGLYDARFRWITATPALKRKIGSNVSLRAGPYFEYAHISPPEGLTADDPLVGYTRDQMSDRYVMGLRSALEVDGRDSTMLPRHGLRFIAEAGVHAGLNSSDVRFARLSSELSAYQSLGPATLALRVGGATNLGDFAFYQANYLGGEENLRGYNDHRFAGHTSAFGNAELRLALTRFNIYLTRGTLGVLGFVDAGRVWADGESSNLWHQGYGGGVWMTPFDLTVLSATVGVSDEGSIFDISFDLFF